MKIDNKKTLLDVSQMDYKAINDWLRSVSGDVQITGCNGQRFIAAGFTERVIHICGTPGNALGAYLNGAKITVQGNAQDAVGDTMNNGKIVIHGSIGVQRDMPCATEKYTSKMMPDTEREFI